MKLSRYKHDSPFSYAFGATLSYELLKTTPHLIRRVFLRPNIKHGADLEKILAELHQHHIEVIESAKPFNILGAKENCLLITEFNKTPHTLDSAPEKPHIVLVNPADAGNLGTIMRSAAAFDYQNLAIITPAVDHYDPKTIRASMGALFHLNIQTFPSFDEYLKTFGENRTLFSFMLDQHAKTLTDITSTSQNYSLIFGNEATGLNPSFATKTQAIFIPAMKSSA